MLLLGKEQRDAFVPEITLVCAALFFALLVQFWKLMCKSIKACFVRGVHVHNVLSRGTFCPVITLCLAPPK